MKALFIGGVKSGKSAHAESFCLALKSTGKPVYLATSEPFDKELKERILHHQALRKDNFITVEEPLLLTQVIAQYQGPVLIECVTLWINNMLFHGYKQKQITAEIETLLALPNDLVFVLNDVGGGIIPDNKLAREFVDISGIAASLIASQCDRVFHCIAGISSKIK